MPESSESFHVVVPLSYLMKASVTQMYYKRHSFGALLTGVSICLPVRFKLP